MQLDRRDDRIEVRAVPTGARLCDAELRLDCVQIDRVHLGNQRIRRLADGEETAVGKVRRARDGLKRRETFLGIDSFKLTIRQPYGMAMNFS